jgi:hypothetical protein
MNASLRRTGQRTAVACALALLLAVSTGCGLLVNLIHAGWGNMVPAQFEGLAEKRVAVVCVASSASYGPRPVSEMIARQVGSLLTQHVKEIDLIDHQAIERWVDENDWNEVDYLEIGHGVGAQRLVAIDLLSFSLHEGQTMYKGRAEVDIKVYDLENNHVVFSSDPSEIQFPRNAGQHTTDISEREFRKRFVNVVANRIARHFYSYDFKDDFARDPTLVGN